MLAIDAAEQISPLFMQHKLTFFKNMAPALPIVQLGHFEWLRCWEIYPTTHSFLKGIFTTDFFTYVVVLPKTC